VPDNRPTPWIAAAKTLNRLRTRGPREVAALGWERARGWVSSGDALVVFVRDAGGTEAAIPGLTFRIGTTADATRYARDIGTDSAASFGRRLTEATRCFVVDDGARLLHASWVTTAEAWTRELKAYLRPPPGDAYIYESFTRDDARGRGIYPYALKSVTTWAYSTGVRRLWVAVEQHNDASLRAVAKAGFVEAFRLPFARRFGRVSVGAATGPQAHEATGFLS